MNKAVRKLIKARPNCNLVKVHPFDNDFAQVGMCFINSRILVKRDPKYKLISGWLVHETRDGYTVVNGHWWNYDTINNMHVDTMQQLWPHTNVSYVIDMEVEKIYFNFVNDMGSHMNQLFDRQLQTVGNLIYENNRWYAFDTNTATKFHDFGNKIDLQLLYGLEMANNMHLMMKPEYFNEFVKYTLNKTNFV